MYKNILLPTDGSALSLVAVDNGLKFAKAVGAKVTGFYVIVERQPESFEDYAPVEVKAPQLDEVAKQEADKYLKVVADKARAAGGRVRDPLDAAQLAAPGHHHHGEQHRLRSHRHGFARPQRGDRRAGRLARPRE